MQTTAPHTHTHGHGTKTGANVLGAVNRIVFGVFIWLTESKSRSRCVLSIIKQGRTPRTQKIPTMT